LACALVVEEDVRRVVAQAKSVVLWDGGGGPPPAWDPLLSDRFLEDDMAFACTVWEVVWCGVGCVLLPCLPTERRLQRLGDDGGP